MIVIHDAEQLRLILASYVLAAVFEALLALLADAPVPFRLASWRTA